MRITRSVTAWVALAIGIELHAQSSPVRIASRAVLEAASVKKSQQNVGGEIAIQPGGRILMTNVRVRDFVNMVYSADPPLLTQQIVGLPAWASVVRYDIEAKFSTDGSDNTFDGRRGVGPYVRSLLEERFAFKAHLEKRELPVYLLTVTDSSKLRPSSMDCSGQENQPPCRGDYGPGHFDGQAVLISTMISELGRATERPVLDRTGLQGRFELHLEWNPNPLDAADARPTIFGVLAEHGLKLEPARDVTEVLVIDHIERAAPD